MLVLGHLLSVSGAPIPRPARPAGSGSAVPDHPCGCPFKERKRGSCCCSAPVEPVKSCCSAPAPEPEPEPALEDACPECAAQADEPAPKAEPVSVRWVSGFVVQRCHGLNPAGLVTQVPAVPGPPPTTWTFEPSSEPHTPSPGDALPFVTFDPPTPPPRNLLA